MLLAEPLRARLRQRRPARASGGRPSAAIRLPRVATKDLQGRPVRAGSVEGVTSPRSHPPPRRGSHGGEAVLRYLLLSIVLSCLPNGLAHSETSPASTDAATPERIAEESFKGPDPSPYYRIVPVGERRTIGFFSTLFPDCSSQGPIVMRLVKKPLHGTITFEEGTSFPRYAATSPVAACNQKRVPGMRLNYEAAEGYEGLDTFRVLVIYPDGTAADIDGHVSVR
jgi:hypothetical protein